MTAPKCALTEGASANQHTVEVSSGPEMSSGKSQARVPDGLSSNRKPYRQFAAFPLTSGRTGKCRSNRLLTGNGQPPDNRILTARKLLRSLRIRCSLWPTAQYEHGV